MSRPVSPESYLTIADSCVFFLSGQQIQSPLVLWPIMAFHDLSKAARRKIRELANVAHERELAAELRRLDELFSRWRSGELDPHDLNDAIHRFHDGPSRQLWSLYTDSDPSFAVEAAITRGILLASEIPSDVAEQFRTAIAAASKDLHKEA
ncbi:MAG TPA: hypothetical protein VIV60_21910 [Polyangiaceae bacterium]